MGHKDEKINHHATVRLLKDGAIQAIDLTIDTGTHHIEIGTPIQVLVEHQNWLGLALVYSIDPLPGFQHHGQLKPGATVKVNFQVAWCYRWTEYFKTAKDSARLPRSEGLAVVSKWRQDRSSVTTDTTFSEVFLSLHMDPLPAEVIVQPAVLHVLPTIDVSALEIPPPPHAPLTARKVLWPGFVARRFLDLQTMQVKPVGAALKTLEQQDDQEFTQYVSMVRQHLRQTQARIQAYKEQQQQAGHGR